MTTYAFHPAKFDGASKKPTVLYTSVSNTLLEQAGRQYTIHYPTVMISIRSTEGDPPDGTHYVLASNHVGIAIAEQLQANGHQVTIVGDSHESGDVPGFAGDPSALDVLSESGAGDASTVIVATCSDRRNLLVAQLVRAHFDIPRVVVLVNDPDRTALFAEAGHEPLCVTTMLSTAVSEAI